MASKTNPRIQMLTDEIINLYAGENKLTTWLDFEDNKKDKLITIPGGVLDSEIFGSCFSNQCNCGMLHGVIGKTCRNCGSEILDEITAWTRFAKIELPVYYCTNIRKKNFTSFMLNNFHFKPEVSEETLAINRASKNSFIWDYCQFRWDPENEVIVYTDIIEDYTKCSYEGLLEIMIEHFPDKLDQYKSYINTNILVLPIIARAPHYIYEDGKRVLQNSEITAIYRTILYAVYRNYPKAMEASKTQQDIALYRATLREFIAYQMESVSHLLLPSKANFARQMQSHRLSNSGRCTIIPAPDLPVDEVYIPRHLMYECCEKEFIDFIQKETGVSYEVARVRYLTEAMSDEIQELFDRFVNEANNGKGKYVIINRNPSLYELSMMACKVRLTNNYTIGLPLLLCSPFGGDYDGDTFSYYVIPNELTDDIIEKMSPRNIVYYKKNQSHLYLPSHEIMGGLIVGTRKIIPEEVLVFQSYDEAYQYKRKTRGFKWQTECIIAGKQTTLARYKLSQLFDCDLEEFLNNGKTNLTSKEIPQLYDKITDYEDRLERIKQIQEFALSVATTSGSTAPKLSELHANLDPEYLEQIKVIEKDQILSDSEKDVKIRMIYEKYMDDIEHGVDANGDPRVSDELKLKISDSSRAKINQLLNIVAEQLTVGPDHVAHITTTSLINGMSPTDYTRHSIENRGTQDIKVSATPRSGYTTRQLVFLGKGFYFSEEDDPKNPGIIIEKSKAAGRTTVDGNIITKEEAKSAGGELVKVRSIVTSKNTDRCIVTKDCISNLSKWKTGDHVGVSLLSSLTEGLTQSGLSLKHGGRLYETDKLASLKAPVDCVLKLTDMFIVLQDKSGKTYVYPKPINFVQNYSKDGSYKKGEVVGVAYRQFTPAYRLDSVIKLIGALSSSSRKSVINNKVLISECFAYNSGEIKYKTIDNEVKYIEIGNQSYSYNPECMYLYPEGTMITKGQRICTGLMDTNAAIKAMKNRTDVFYLFYNQFNELIPGMTPELIEFIFSLIITLKDGRIVNKKVASAVLDSPGFFNALAFREAKKTLRKIDYEGIEFIPDASSEMFLPSLMMMDYYLNHE